MVIGAYSSRDHNRETVLQHIRTAHYQQQTNNVTSSGGGNATATTNHNNGSSSSSMTLSSTGLTSGGQVLTVGNGNGNGGDPLLPPPAVPLLMAPLSGATGSSTGAPAFRCGVCNQVSNWKHVIQVV